MYDTVVGLPNIQYAAAATFTLPEVVMRNCWGKVQNDVLRLWNYTDI